MTNISPLEITSHLLQTIGQPARLQILLAIGAKETCVCHLEAVLGWRQAYLSQHLMALREAGIVTDRREGRYIHYRLAEPALLSLLEQAAALQGVKLPGIPGADDCTCPQCSRENTPSC